MSWTESDLRSYTQRRLASEQRTREAIQADGLPKYGGTFTRIVESTIAPKQPKTRGTRYSLPVVLAWMREMGIPEPVFEYRFCERMWRWDIAWVPQKLSCEVNGGVFVQGRHNRGAALLEEYAKLSRGAALGWRVIFTTPDRLMTQATAETIRQALSV